METKIILSRMKDLSKAFAISSHRVKFSRYFHQRYHCVRHLGYSRIYRNVSTGVTQHLLFFKVHVLMESKETQLG